jgi:hypothetical protein
VSKFRSRKTGDWPQNAAGAVDRNFSARTNLKIIEIGTRRDPKIIEERCPRFDRVKCRIPGLGSRLSRYLLVDRYLMKVP